MSVRKGFRKMKRGGHSKHGNSMKKVTKVRQWAAQEVQEAGAETMLRSTGG